ncbi:MAG: hypothetical protein ACT4O1_00635 [Gemmatimonadota bacterium]
MLQNAIDAYHSLLTDELAQESEAQLTAQLRQRGLFFGERPLMSVLRPRFLAPEQYRFLQNRVSVLLGAFEKIYAAALFDPTFRSQFALLDWEETLVTEDPGFAEPSPVSRLDAFFVNERGGLRFTEYNAETPAGAAYNDALSDVCSGLPVMREFLRRFEVRPIPARHNVLHALLHAYAQFAGNSRAKPRIAILDWHDVPTRHEFVLSREYFESQGCECIIADVNDTEYRDGRLFVGGRQIDLIYKRVLINELIERGGLEHPIVRAVRERAVCMVNPFRCKILHKKLSLAVLSDEQNRAMFDVAEQGCIDTHIPWTRRVEERKTRFHGDVVDLLPFAAENRERLVLKPNDDYGGAGIVLGWLVDADQWRQALQHALAQPFIVQERIDLPTEKYPVLANGSLRIEDRIEDTAPFCFYGQFMDGCMSRISTEALVNVTAGGGSSVPTMIVAPR